MKRDREEELERLQQELLAEEEESAPQEEKYLDEETIDELLEDEKAGSAGVYQNYSNNYGKDLRNFASGYQAYNTDDVDVDMDEFSEEVEDDVDEDSQIIWPVALIASLMLLVVGAIIWQFVRLGGGM